MDLWEEVGGVELIIVDIVLSIVMVQWYNGEEWLVRTTYVSGQSQDHIWSAHLQLAAWPQSTLHSTPSYLLPALYFKDSPQSAIKYNIYCGVNSSTIEQSLIPKFDTAQSLNRFIRDIVIII